MPLNLHFFVFIVYLVCEEITMLLHNFFFVHESKSKVRIYVVIFNESVCDHNTFPTILV